MGDRSVVQRTIYGSAPPYSKGGRISTKKKKGKLIRVHSGEVVLPKKEVTKLEKLIHNKRSKNKRGKK
jgi:hypothetical protein